MTNKTPTTAPDKKEAEKKEKKGIWALIKGGLKLILPNALTLAIAGSAFFWYTNKMYKNGEQVANDRHAALQAEIKTQGEEMTKQLGDAVTKIGEETGNRVTEINHIEGETKTIIEREIIEHPRLSDPEQGLTDGLFEAVNKARQETHPK